MIPRSFQRDINQELTTFFQHKKESAKDKRLVELISQIEDVTLRGGDRLRPYLCYLGFKAISRDTNIKILMPIFLSLELTHSYFLIHDDIMDEAEMRRGGRTIHAHFTQNLRKPHLAKSLALLAGDLVNHWAEDLWEEILKTTKGREAWQLFNLMKQEVIYGQTLDISGMVTKNVTGIKKVYMLKTSGYSVEKPLLLGAIIAGGGQIQLHILSKFGRAVGLAFQFRDDWLGLFGKEKSTGKSSQSDIKEGKWTPFMAQTYQKLVSKERKQLLAILGNSAVTTTEAAWVKRKAIETGAQKAVERETQQLVKNALSDLKKAPLLKKAELSKLATFLAERDY